MIELKMRTICYKGPETERSSFYVESLPAPLASPDVLSEVSSVCSRNSVRKFPKLPKIIKMVVVTFSSSKIRVRDQFAKLQSELKLGRRVVNESEETNNGAHKVLK